MSVDATIATWKLQNITAIQKIILLSLADRAGESGECWPSLKRLEADTCLNRKTIIKNRQELIEKGFIVYTGEYKGRQNQIPVMRLTYIKSRIDDDEMLSTTSPKSGTGTGPKSGTGNQYQNWDTEPKRSEPTNEPFFGSLSPKARPTPSVNESNSLNPEYEYPETLYQQRTKNDIETSDEHKKTLGVKKMLENNPFGIPESYLQDWVTNRKAKRAPITMTAWHRLNKELLKIKENGFNPVSAFENMVANGWVSISADWKMFNKKKESYVVSDSKNENWRSTKKGLI